MWQPIFLATTITARLLRPSSVSMSTTMEITFDCSFFVRLLLLGSQGGASSSEVSPYSIGVDRWNRYTKLGPFFSASSFDHNFRPNNTIKHSLYKSEEYTNIIQNMLMWFFRSSEIPLERFLGGESIV